jgi:hypothetical protein
MKEASVGLSDAHDEAAASMGIPCKRERRVAFIESPHSVFSTIML